MRKVVILLFCVLSFSIAQGIINLSTTDEQSVLVHFVSAPEGAELYINDTFVGRTPMFVRLDAYAKVSYRLRVPDAIHEDYYGVVNLNPAVDGTVGVGLAKVGGEPVVDSDYQTRADEVFSDVDESPDFNANIFDLDFWKTATVADVQQLSQQGVDWNSRHESAFTPTLTPLMFAVSASNNPEVILALLEAGADVNAKDIIEMTPLMYASMENRNPDIIKILLEAGADVNASYLGNWTPLIVASIHQNTPDVIRALLEGGANINAQDKDGNTAIAWAVRLDSNSDVLRAFLESGANINLQDKYGWTTLMFAALYSNSEVVQILLEAGADVGIRNRDGKLALDYAKKNPNIYQSDVYYELLESAEGIATQESLLPQQPTSEPNGDFRGFTWGTTKEVVQANESATLISVDNVSLKYEGSVGDYDAMIYFNFLSTGELAKGGYSIREVYINPQNYVEDFTSIDNILTGLYGSPVSQDEVWVNELYKDSPRDWGLALESGDLSLYSIFSNEKTQIQHRLYTNSDLVFHFIMYFSYEYGDQLTEESRQRESEGF